MCLVFSMLDYDTENLNSDEIYSSLRGVTEAIEKFSFRSQEDLNEPIKRDGKKDCDVVSKLYIFLPDSIHTDFIAKLGELNLATFGHFITYLLF